MSYHISETHPGLPQKVEDEELCNGTTVNGKNRELLLQSAPSETILRVLLKPCKWTIPK